jgi:uncharacterized protein YebE (UPF0316 family)
MNAILIFAIATIVNVTLSTIRALCTIKGGKWLSASMNALCYGFYPLIVMLTAKGTVDIIINMIITALANFVCVWLIKFVEEKARKDKMWKVEMAIPLDLSNEVIEKLKSTGGWIPFNYNYLGKWCIFNCYCDTQDQTKFAKDLAKNYNGKISAYESKSLI